MILSSNYFEMNQAVPGTLASPLMEPSFECEVPSPSQWSDPCGSPPSLHSPTHFPSDLDKLKEEPLSPLSSYPVLTSPPSYYSYSTRPMSREGTGGETSLDLAELLAENQTLQARVQQQHPPTQPRQAQHQQQRQPPQPRHVTQQQRLQSSEEYPVEFLEGLAKPEFKQEDSKPLTLISFSPESTPTTSGNGGDVLCIALEHYRQGFEEISNMLNISKDPSKWSIQDVKSWLQFEANKLRLPVPFLDRWQIPGSNLVQLSETQFRELLPEGGNLFYANLEIWKAAFRTSIPEIPRRVSPPVSQLQQIFDFQSTVSQSAGPSTFQTSISQTMIPTPVPSSPMVISSPEAHTLSQIATAGSSQPNVTRSPLRSPPMQVPISVLEESPKQPVSPKTSEIDPRTYLKDVPAVVASESVPKTVLASSDLSQERRDTENVDEEPSTSSTGRGSTHIHLWQFLKELLQKPQEHGACIRWLDRSKGVFKIEDSVRVARLWGRRKNRPAMNYDKLSRSIRQYYKKGIMKKTERSQRLVYQFCHPYSL